MSPSGQTPAPPAARSGFCHLHVHSDFSALDGAVKVGDLVKKAAELGQPAVALTDHGVLSGAIQFYKAAKKEGVKPLLGIETYVVEDRRRKDHAQEERWHLTLLAENTTGYRNLLSLGSRAFMEGYYFKPRVDYEVLGEHAEGVICLTGCPSGRLSKAIEQGRHAEARRDLETLQAIFGERNVFLEVQQTGIEELAHIAEGIMKVAAETGVPPVATNDVHYLEARDAAAHDVLLCIQTGARLSDERRMRFSSEEFYFKSEEEMLAAFADHPEAVANTVLVADRCDVDLELGGILLPSYPVGEGRTESSYLRELCEEGLTRRYGAGVGPAHRERLETELATIEEMGFPPYFLIVWDFVSYAKQSGIPVGPGRGSAAGSLVSYLLGITDLDPLEYNLLFERFLNPARISMPDIDIDFSVEGREQVIDYVAERYGRDRVAQIATFGTIKARQAVRDAARVMDVSYADADKIAKLIPEGPKVNLDDCLKEKQELRAEYDKNELVKRVVDMARPLEGLIRQDSIHAAGVVISDKPLTEYLPLMQKGDAEVVTQVPMGDVEDLGLLKMDFLGLRNLDVIQSAVGIIRDSADPNFELDGIPLDDVKTYDMLACGESVGVFQFESSGMREAMRDIRPSAFDDLIALVALYRPGPMEFIPQYARNKRNPEQVEVPDPRLEPILRPTYGVAIYQEQLMEIAKVMAGFSPAEADDLRKGIGKKNRTILDRLEPKFEEGAKANGTDPAVVRHLWNLMEKAGDYSFNKSHAACYAFIAYQTAYLKANYPVEYMAALISSVMNTKDKVPFYVGVANDMGIEVLPPDVNESAVDFRAVGGRIRFGLNAVKNVGENAIRDILEARKVGGPFTDIFDFCGRIDLQKANRRALESLIKAGAMDSFGHSRKGMLYVLPQAIGHGQQAQADSQLGQGSIFDLLNADGGDGQAAGSGTAAVTNGNGYSTEIPEADFGRKELLALEKETLGLYVSSHPLRDIKEHIIAEAETRISALKGLPDGEVTTIIGMVSAVKRITTKKTGETMAFVTVQGLDDSVEMLCFPKFYGEHKERLEEDSVVRIRGRVDRKDETETKLIPFEVEAFVPKTGLEPVRITFDGEAFPVEALEDLKAVLGRFPGACPVEAHIATPAGPRLLRFGERFKVDPQTSLFAELKCLLGDGCVAQTQ